MTPQLHLFPKGYFEVEKELKHNKLARWIVKQGFKMTVEYRLDKTKVLHFKRVEQ